MKIIFLDIDGVLNSDVSTEQHKEEGYFNNLPDIMHVEHLNKIVDKTGAKVVISSTWRMGCPAFCMARILYLCGFTGEVIADTPKLNDYRGNEIQAWINRYENGKDWMNHNEHCVKLESFVILDDDADMLHLKEFLVQTDGKTGLTGDHAEHAIRVLNGNRSGDK